ncbi:MAG: DUF3078 domain-containing protein [Balneolaceae bacterium]|nr:DUF3078 domain-containing protein [Balneolaceae bacterium]
MDRHELKETGTRKTDDKIFVSNQFSYRFQDERFNFFGNINFSTQFDKGYDYGQDPKALLSRFMAPGYFSQVFGVGYEPARLFFSRGWFGYEGDDRDRYRSFHSLWT